MEIRKPSSAFAVALSLCCAAGCHHSPGQMVLWQKPGAGEVVSNGNLPATTDPGGYKPVGEYPVPAPAPSSEDGNGDAKPGAQPASPVPAPAGADRRDATPHNPGSQQAANAAVVVGDASQSGAAGEPIESQHKLVPQLARTQGFWEKTGNRMQNMFQFARGKRPIAADSVAPLTARAAKAANEAVASATSAAHRVKSAASRSLPHSKSLSLAQTAASDDATEPTLNESDLVSHWSAFPAQPGVADAQPDLAKPFALSPAEPASPINIGGGIEAGVMSGR